MPNVIVHLLTTVGAVTIATVLLGFLLNAYVNRSTRRRRR